MSDHRNTVPPTADSEGKVWITMHTAIGGVTLPDGSTIDPGDTKRVPLAIAQSLVLTDRARYAEAPAE